MKNSSSKGVVYFIEKMYGKYSVITETEGDILFFVFWAAQLDTYLVYILWAA
jgi:hypothetical protein